MPTDAILFLQEFLRFLGRRIPCIQRGNPDLPICKTASVPQDMFNIFLRSNERRGLLDFDRY